MTHNQPALDRYRVQKSKAKNRGIDFRLTFDEWYHWWLSCGVDKNLDVTPNDASGLCMCRTGDTGAYELGNIYCATRAQNSQHARQHDPRTGRTPGFARHVRTPDGVFESANSAGEYYGVTGEAINWRIQHWDGWENITQFQNGRRVQTPAGVFSSTQEAAKAMRLHCTTIRRRIKQDPTEYRYV
jgi:hypothetical protein